MYGCESWTIKQAECRRIDAFELWCWRRLLRVPWTARRSNPKGNHPNIHWKDWCWSWSPILWPPDAINWLIWRDPDTGKDGRWEEKVMTEDEMVGWHHWLGGRQFEQALRVDDGQGSLACCSPWGHNESDTNVRLNWTVESRQNGTDEPISKAETEMQTYKTKLWTPRV